MAGGGKVLKADNLKVVAVSIYAAVVLLLFTDPGYGSNAVADTGNCLLCHRYPSIGRYDEKGNKHHGITTKHKLQKHLNPTVHEVSSLRNGNFYL